MTRDADISALLLKRAAAGDQTAVEDLLALHRDRLKRMVRLRLSRRLSSRVDSGRDRVGRYAGSRFIAAAGANDCGGSQPMPARCRSRMSSCKLRLRSTAGSVSVSGRRLPWPPPCAAAAQAGTRRRRGRG